MEIKRGVQKIKIIRYKFSACPVLILVGDKDKTGKVKQYCIKWAEKTGYPLHIIKGAAHFSNGDKPEEVNSEIEQFIKTC